MNKDVKKLPSGDFEIIQDDKSKLIDFKAETMVRTDDHNGAKKTDREKIEQQFLNGKEQQS